MFGWHGGLTAAQTAEIAGAKQVIYDGFKTAIAEGAPKNKAGILVDEQFGAAKQILEFPLRGEKHKQTLSNGRSVRNGEK
jgi:hypothetical protein